VKINHDVDSVPVGGLFECSAAIAAAQGVRKSWRAHDDLQHRVLAVTSALDATSSRHISRWPFPAERCSGVDWLIKSGELQCANRG
jgi:hypothetical protein